MKCKECGHEEMTGALFCSECGAYLVAKQQTSVKQTSSSDSLPTPEQPSLWDQELPPSEEASQVSFLIPSSGRRVNLSLDEAIYIGRADPAKNNYPELDLTEDNGAEYGVSRLHAAVKLSHQGVVITDLNSTNGTILNNFRLPSDLPYPLHSGDELRFGYLLVNVFLED
jgi:pSer/pThr/pTyr-binding forkhead associated (FHA) protein